SLYRNSASAKVCKRHGLRALLALCGTIAEFDTALECVFPTSPAQRIGVLIKRRRLHATADGVGNDVVRESQRTRDVGNAIRLRKGLHHIFSDVRTVVGGVSLLASVSQTESEFVQDRR